MEIFVSLTGLCSNYHYGNQEQIIILLLSHHPIIFIYSENFIFNPAKFEPPRKSSPHLSHSPIKSLDLFVSFSILLTIFFEESKSFQSQTLPKTMRHNHKYKISIQEKSLLFHRPTSKPPLY